MPSTERRITVLASIYPRLKEWADRDGLTVADVANAILLQTIRPYGHPSAAPSHQPHADPLCPASVVSQPIPDPYTSAALDSW